MSSTKGSTWSKYKIKRRAVLRFLSALYNKKKREAVFKEDGNGFPRAGMSIEKLIELSI